MEGLGGFEAQGVSGDGSVVVGVDSGSPNEAFIWDATNGMRNLRDVLINDFSLDLTGWLLLQASGISPDGLSIVGTAINPSGQEERLGQNGKVRPRSPSRDCRRSRSGLSSSRCSDGR